MTDDICCNSFTPIASSGSYKPPPMTLKIIETKMSELHVVQTVLDFWDPYSASIYRSSTLNQIDEYDNYSFPILSMLRAHSSHEELFQFLNQTGLERGLFSQDENKSINRFFAWALLQTWHAHQAKDTNIRQLHFDSVQLPAEPRRPVPKLELVQQYLQQWDPLEKSKHWLYGADTLNHYDKSSVTLYQAIETKEIEEVKLLDDSRTIYRRTQP